MDSNEKTVAEAPWPSPFRAWSALLVLVLAYSLSYADRTIMSLLIGPIRHDLAISDFQVSLLIGVAFALFYVIMGVPFGMLADRVNRRNFIAAGVLAWSVATALCGMAGSFSILFVARMIVGVGEATLSPSAYSLLGDMFPRVRLGRAISVYVIGSPLGTGLSLALGGLLVGALTRNAMAYIPGLGEFASWRVVFAVLLIPGLIVAALLFTFAEPARRSVPASKPGLGEVFGYMAKHARTFLCLFGGVSMLSAAVYGPMAWIPTFFVRTYHMPVGEAGIYFGLIVCVAGTLGLIVGGEFGDYFLRKGRADGHMYALALTALAGIVPSVLMPLAPNPWLALGLLSVSYFFISGVSTSTSATSVQLVAPNHLRGQLASIYILTASVAGIGLGPTTVAALTDYVFANDASLRYSLAILYAVSLPLAALFFFLGLKSYRATAASIAADAA